MSNSLQEQLLKAGLIDPHKARENTTEKRKQSKQKKRNKAPENDPLKTAIKEAEAEKIARDRALNEARQAERRRHEQAAQIAQMIAHARITDTEGDVAYHFTHESKVRTLHVSPQTQKHLANGRLAIVADQDRFAIVRADVAARILARDAEYFVYVCDATDDGLDENDPYAAFQVPDDLMW